MSVLRLLQKLMTSILFSLTPCLLALMKQTVRVCLPYGGPGGKELRVGSSQQPMKNCGVWSHKPEEISSRQQQHECTWK